MHCALGAMLLKPGFKHQEVVMKSTLASSTALYRRALAHGEGAPFSFNV
jgi:hypothetical protein